MRFQATFKNFQNYILHEAPEACQDIVSTDQMSAKARLDVYRNGYYLRLMEIVTLDFPALRKSLGEEAFGVLARDYVNQHPSSIPSIIHFSQYFCEFLQNRQGIEDIHKELAAFEWALEKANFAQECIRLNLEVLSNVQPDAWDQLKLILHASVQLFSFSYDVPAIWNAVSDGETLPQIKKTKESIYYLVWFFDQDACFRPLTKQEYLMLVAIRAGKNFGDVCEVLCRQLSEEEVVPFAIGCLQRYVQDGLFIVNCE